MADMYFEVALLGRWAICTDQTGRTALAKHEITPEKINFAVEMWFEDRTTAYAVAYEMDRADREQGKQERNEEHRNQIEAAPQAVRPPGVVAGEAGGGVPLGPWNGGAVVRWLRGTLAGRAGLHRQARTAVRANQPDH